MSNVRRVYVEKKAPYAVHAKELKEELFNPCIYEDYIKMTEIKKAILDLEQNLLELNNKWENLYKE